MMSDTGIGAVPLPKESLPDDKKRPKRVYTLKHIMGGAFVFGPLTGCWFIASNYKLFGLEEKVFRVRLIGIVLTALLPAVFYLLSGSPLRYSYVLIPFLIHRYAKKEQMQKINEAMARGVPKASECVVFFIGAAFLILTYFAFLIELDVLSNCYCSLRELL